MSAISSLTASEGLKVTFDQLSLSLDWRRNHIEEERATIIRGIVRDIRTEIEQILWEDLAHEDLPSQGAVHFFPLGEGRRIRLAPITGQTTLYLGSDGALYEYGPVLPDYWDEDEPVEDNLISLRVLELEELPIYALVQCVILLRSIWI